MTAIVHILGSPSYSFDVPSLLTVWFRSVTQLTLAAIYLILFVDIRSHLPAFTRSVILLVLLRGTLGTIGFICLFKSLALLPLGDAITLFFLGPIFTLILTYQTLGERVAPLEWLLSLISFLGVALISRPALSASAVPHHVLGVILAISAAALSAGAYSVVRSLGQRIHFMFNVLSLGLCSSIGWLTCAMLSFCCFLIGVDGKLLVTDIFFAVTTVWLWPTLAASVRGYAASNATLTLLLLQGFFAFFGQCFLNSALQYAGGLSVMMRNLDVPIAYAFGIGLGEVPTWQAGVGSAMVVVASATISFRRAMRARAR